ncbi:MAG: glycosyltransferase [Verrucomicrobiae bacterium]|nr:glycosyltransferase [Verrucomicrobiae bacterium]
MKVLFTIAGLQPEYGGPSRCVPALAIALAERGVQVELISCESAPGQPLPLLPSVARISPHLLPGANRSIRWWPRANDFWKVLRERGKAGRDWLIHDHGLWLPNNHAVARAASSLKVPRIVSLHGMLTAWSRRHQGWKKAMAWWLYQRLDLKTASVLHATSPAEVQELRKAGLTQPLAMIPNGVELPPGNPKSEIGNRKSGARTVLFLGRIHPIKGLLNLVRAWAILRPAGWRVVLAGNDEGGHENEIKAECRKQKVEPDFDFLGPVEGGRRWDLYRSADLFVLPSHSENFGIVVAEALACGVPVITTRGTPWQDLVLQGCGWWTEIGVEPLAAALREATALDEEVRREMGACGRQLVETKYGWPRIAARMQAVYAWMLGHGEKPEAIAGCC